MYYELKENRPHGTQYNPFSVYHIHNIKHSFQIPVHWHDELEIIYVKRGTLNVTIAGENYTGNEGEAFVVSQGSLHFMGSHTGDVDYYTFLFPLQFISFKTDDFYEQMIMSPLMNKRLSICHEIGTYALDICEKLIDVCRQNLDDEQSVSVQIDTKIILMQFIQRMSECGFLIENETSGRNNIEKEMISYIQQNFTDDISLRDFGAQFHLSEKYISRYFKQHFNITLSQYLNHLRLKCAVQLLQDTELTVTEVALQSGYQNVSYFIRCFKKMYGVSPLKYRRKL